MYLQRSKYTFNYDYYIVIIIIYLFSDFIYFSQLTGERAKVPQNFAQAANIYYS